MNIKTVYEHMIKNAAFSWDDIRNTLRITPPQDAGFQRLREDVGSGLQNTGNFIRDVANPEFGGRGIKQTNPWDEFVTERDYGPGISTKSKREQVYDNAVNYVKGLLAMPLYAAKKEQDLLGLTDVMNEYVPLLSPDVWYNNVKPRNGVVDSLTGIMRYKPTVVPVQAKVYPNAENPDLRGAATINGFSNPKYSDNSVQGTINAANKRRKEFEAANKYTRYQERPTDADRQYAGVVNDPKFLAMAYRDATSKDYDYLRNQGFSTMQIRNMLLRTRWDPAVQQAMKGRPQTLENMTPDQLAAIKNNMLKFYNNDLEIKARAAGELPIYRRQAPERAAIDKRLSDDWDKSYSLGTGTANQQNTTNVQGAKNEA